MSDQERTATPPTTDQQEQQQQQQNQEETLTTSTSKPTDESTSSTAAQQDGQEQQPKEKEAPAPPQRRKVNTGILGNLVTQTVISNLPAGAKPVPEWKRKQLEREAIARGETIPEKKEGENGTEGADGATTASVTGEIGGLYRPPHQRLPPAPLVSQQAQERSAFPGDFWFHKEIENLISKTRRKVDIKENEDDAFFDRGGKAGKGVIASYIVDAFPLVRNARPKHIREAMEMGEIYPENSKIEIVEEKKKGQDSSDEDADVADNRGDEDDY